MSERSAVQAPMLRYAGDIGWEVLPQTEALRLRGGETGLYLTEVLRQQFLHLNPGILDEGRADEIIRQLNLLPPTIAGNQEVLSWLRGEKSVFVPSENRERNVTLIHYGDLTRNQFHVTDEWRYRGAVFANRADVVFLINGIPVAVAETKREDKSDGVAEGVHQFRRYHRETPEMMLAPQVFEVTQMLDFFYGVTWNVSRKGVFNWREESPESTNYEQKIKAFFDRERFLRLLRDYIVFLSKDDETTKIVLRQHQSRAVEAVIDRVRDPVKRRGLVWHTQGSGKTLTMITIAARLLREAEGGEKPTVLMLVDRNELEQQLFKNISAYGIENVEVAQSKTDLQRLLREDRRGLLVSMIHKFDDIPKDLNTRESIVVLVDEAHRTTGGDLGNYLEGALPNATYIGFTGTPVDNLAHGKGTFKVFGRDDPDGYTDKYSVARSIEDGTTVKLNYALAPSELRADPATLDREFFALMDTEGVSDVEELDAILDRSVVLKEMMKSASRVDRIAQFVAGHFRENVEPLGFKAFLVGVDREACVLYKEALDRYLPPEYSVPVYSPAHNDDASVKRYYLSPQDEKEIRKTFSRKGTLPRILIVTQKLLTGFDAPILYAMYLDKPMRDHVLLQAIARVNRPYEDDDGLVKPFGFVLDFVGLFDKLEKALAFDSDTVASIIQNIDVLRQLFETLMRETAPHYLPLTRGWDDKAKERAIEHFAQENTRKTFFKFFRQLQNLYDILSPAPYLRDHIEPYKALGELYGLIRNAYSSRVYVDKELSAKTKALLRLHTDGGAITAPGEIHELGPAELAALKGGSDSDTVKVLNLRKVLQTTVEQKASGQPFLVTIGERARALAEAYEDRQITTQQALRAFEALAEEVIEADGQREKLGVDANTFALLLTLQRYTDRATPDHARDLNAHFAAHPDYLWNDQQKARLRIVLYQALRDLVEPARLVETANALLRLERV